MEKILTGFIVVIGILLSMSLLLGLPLMILWNWLMPTLFNLPVIGFWQAVGLNLISGILFGKSSLNKD
jgi:hypothetical protein